MRQEIHLNYKLFRYQEELPDGVGHVSPGFAVLQAMSLGLAVKLGPDGEGLIQAVNTSAEKHSDGNDVMNYQ